MIQNQVGGGSGDVFSVLTGTQYGATGLTVPGLTDKHKVLSIQTAEKFDLSTNGYWLIALSVEPDSLRYLITYFDNRRSLFWAANGAGGHSPISISGTTISLIDVTAKFAAVTYQVLVYGPPI